MAEEKKYYWLKLKEDFFRQAEIKKLRKIAGGDTYTIIYLKMQLLSLKKEGRLYFTGLEDNFIEEIALEIDEESENVSITIQYLVKCGLLETLNENEFLLNKASLSMGSETQSAERVRQFRERKKGVKVLQSNATVTKSNTEIEKEIEIEKYIDTKPKEIEDCSYPNKKEIENDIVEVRKLYQGTKSKATADLKIPPLLKKYSKDELIRGIERYNKYVKAERKTGFKDLKFKNEKTYWNGGYVDYLDENFTTDINKVIKPKMEIEVKNYGK